MINLNNNKITFKSITAAEAKKMMDSDKEIRILDVRTKDEYLDGHIEHATLLAVADVELEAEDVLPDKDQTVLVYCRSGVKSRIASQQLAELGYSNVYEFGGILNWPYEVVKE